MMQRFGLYVLATKEYIRHTTPLTVLKMMSSTNWKYAAYHNTNHKKTGATCIKIGEDRPCGF